MRTHIVLFGLLLLVFSPSASAESLTGYSGADGGWLVLSATTGPLPLGADVKITLRRSGEPFRQRVATDPSALFSHPDATAPTFDDKTEALISRAGWKILDGKTYTNVMVLRMPPGSYEIEAVSVAGQMNRARYISTFEAHPIPFEIKTGRTAYLGAFNLTPMLGELVGVPEFAFWRLIIDDLGDRDLPIAAAKTPGLGPVERGADLGPPGADATGYEPTEGSDDGSSADGKP